jgi:hypothetical protein
MSFENLTVNDTIKTNAPYGGYDVKTKAVMVTVPTTNPILHIDKGILGTRDIFGLGPLGCTSPTVVNMRSSPTAYTNCVRSDIGKKVKDDGVIISDTVLAYYDNDAREWWLSKPHSTATGSAIAYNSALTIDNGTGAGYVNTTRATNGGAIMLGQGFEREDDPPRISLTDSGNHTLYITAGSSVPNGADSVLANMKLKRLDATEVVHGGGGNGDAFLVGDDIYLVDVNEGDALCLQGVYNRQSAKVYFGSGRDCALYRSGTSTLETINNIFPSTYNTYHLGSNTKYWNGVWANYLMYHSNVWSFDSIEDLETLKNIRTISNEEGKQVYDPETLKHLKNADGFYSQDRMDGWHISIEKRLLEKIEMLEQRIGELTGRP